MWTFQRTGCPRLLHAEEVAKFLYIWNMGMELEGFKVSRAFLSGKDRMCFADRKRFEECCKCGGSF